MTTKPGIHFRVKQKPAKRIDTLRIHLLNADSGYFCVCNMAVLPAGKL